MDKVNSFDRTVLQALRSPGDMASPLGPEWLREISRDFTALSGTTLLGLLAIFGTALLWAMGRKAVAIRMWIVLGCGWASSSLVKLLFNRPRPGLAGSDEHFVSSSFPSGHALMAVLFYSLFALVALSMCSRPGVRRVIIYGTGLIVFLSGITRIHLGVHWPTDVIAGWIVGAFLAWLGWSTVLKPKVVSQPGV